MLLGSQIAPRLLQVEWNVSWAFPGAQSPWPVLGWSAVLPISGCIWIKSDCSRKMGSAESKEPSAEVSGLVPVPIPGSSSSERPALMWLGWFFFWVEDYSEETVLEHPGAVLQFNRKYGGMFSQIIFNTFQFCRHFSRVKCEALWGIEAA